MAKPTIKVMILEKEFNKIRELVKQAPKEVLGFGRVKLKRRLDDGRGNNRAIFIEEILPLPLQEVSGASADGEVDSFMEFLDQYPDKSAIKFWWHSHVDMGVFWSGKDDLGIDTMSHGDFAVSMVLNKKGEIKMRFDYFVPFRMTVEDIELEIIKPEAKELEDWAKNELATKIVKPKPAPVKDYWKDRGHNRYNDLYGRGMYNDEGDVEWQKRFNREANTKETPKITMAELGNEIARTPSKRERKTIKRMTTSSNNGQVAMDILSFLTLAGVTGITNKASEVSEYLASLDLSAISIEENQFIYKGEESDELGTNENFKIWLNETFAVTKDIFKVHAEAAAYIKVKMANENGYKTFTRLEYTILSLLCLTSLMEFVETMFPEMVHEILDEHDLLVEQEILAGTLRKCFGDPDAYAYITGYEDNSAGTMGKLSAEVEKELEREQEYMAHSNELGRYCSGEYPCMD